MPYAIPNPSLISPCLFPILLLPPYPTTTPIPTLLPNQCWKLHHRIHPFRGEGCRSVGRDLSYLKKEEKRRKPTRMAFTYLPQSSPNKPPPPSLDNLQYPHRKKKPTSRILIISSNDYERATAGLSSQAVLYLISFKQSLSKFEIPPQKGQKIPGESR